MTTYENAPKIFDPEKSQRASYLNNLSDKELFQRYFVRDNNISWVDDLNEEKERTLVSNPEKNVYPLTLSIFGQPLNYFCALIHKKIAPFAPSGYKLNAKSILEDLEAMLSENKNETRKVAVSGKTSLFIVQIANFTLELHDRGIEFKCGTTVD